MRSHIRAERFTPCFSGVFALEVNRALHLSITIGASPVKPHLSRVNGQIARSVKPAQNFTFTWKPIVNGRLSEGIGGTTMKFAPTRLYSIITMGATTGPIV
ncbi:hypothetical protein SAMN05192539_100359 [Paraburkholderia diazotrophica]|uniref:Uncharacterized protein n=1 Tax=Paraburkholderia diazotrophica TaxID=667676 RepID=A0A1H6S9U9_9BURK|nr:hypothetical protein SAMN05192539_100359 [Paraburkholderia diazotrophica]